jgi:uncharacterized cupredoxin-like copper-binding protein
MSSIGSSTQAKRRHTMWPVVLAIVSVVLATGCGASGSTVKVTLGEWSVQRDKAEVPAGSIVFDVSNSGPDDTHEFVVIKTDLDAGALPTDDTGAVDEAGGGMTVEGEIEEIAVGASDTLTLDLAAGSYVLLCNIYTAEENEAHYQQGMRIDFTVN